MPKFPLSPVTLSSAGLFSVISGLLGSEGGLGVFVLVSLNLPLLMFLH
jgi:hypothetical protein